jgi:hypothetical protein
MIDVWLNWFMQHDNGYSIVSWGLKAEIVDEEMSIAK